MKIYTASHELWYIAAIVLMSSVLCPGAEGAIPYDKVDADGHFVNDFKRDYIFDFYNVLDSIPVYFRVAHLARGRKKSRHYNYTVSGARLVDSTGKVFLYGAQVPESGGRVTITEHLCRAGTSKKGRDLFSWPKISVSDPLPLCINLGDGRVPPPDKETVGAFVELNDDDDDRDGLVDLRDDFVVNGDNELTVFKMQHPYGFPVSLTWDPAIIRLYKTRTKMNWRKDSSLVGGGRGQIVYNGYDNQIVYAEGISTGSTVLILTGPGGFSDRLKLTVGIPDIRIKAENGQDSPLTEMAIGTNVRYKAVLATPLKGQYQWSVQSGKIALSNATEEIITVLSGSDSSDRLEAEILRVAFSPAHSSVSFKNAQALTVAKIQALNYRLGTNMPWTPMTDALYVAQNTQVEFQALSAPTGFAWPTNTPVWSGEISGSGSAVTSCLFTVASTSATDYKLVSAAFGESVTGKVIVLNAGLVADFNHDRVIDKKDVDVAKSNTFFRFWINDDDDYGDISGDDSDIPGLLSPPHELDGRTADCANSRVDGRSDLLDLFPLWVDLKQALDILPPGKGVEYKLRQDDEAVKIVYTDLTKERAGAFLTSEVLRYGSSFDRFADYANTVAVPTSGVVLSEAFLKKIRQEKSKGVLLVEGAKATIKPLVLETWKDNRKLYVKEMPLCITEVERMYRWVNLRAMAGGNVYRQTDISIPANYPDSQCDGKQFVFVHGYNVDERHARGWNAEMFKRLYQSGSRAMFTAVTWYGDESRINERVPLVGGRAPNYYVNVIHAFETAAALGVALNGLPGRKYIAAHSLGNMLVSSAINDYRVNVDAYFMLDAAVAMEAYKGEIMNRYGMGHPDWQRYTNRLWACEWHKLFDPNDGRRNLTWRDRFSNISCAYNYYSSGEDVLNNSYGVLPDIGAEYAWVNQEMRKGTWLVKIGPGRSHGGWGFNDAVHIGYGTNVQADVGGFEWSRLNPSQAAALIDMQLRSNSFFKRFDNSELYGMNGGVVARDRGVRAQILAEAIPALSFAVGRNRVNHFGSNSLDMATMENLVWPRPMNRWTHGDIKDVAYPFNYRVFDDIVIKMEGAR